VAQCGNVGKAEPTEVLGRFYCLIFLGGAQFMKSFDTGCAQTELEAVVLPGRSLNQ